MSASSPGTPELYVVYLGGDSAPGQLSEDHEVVVVAPNVKDARAAARAKWRGSSKAHVEAVRAIKVVDGFAINLVDSDLGDVSELDVTCEPVDVSEAT